VVYLEKKVISGNSYYYAIENAWIDGRSRKTRTVYLGTAEGILSAIEAQKSGAPAGDDRVRVKSFPFGPMAALLRTAKDLRFVEAVDHYAHKRSTPGFSVGQYLLLCILARALEPWSKAATGRWFYRKSFLRFVWDAPHEVNSQNILSNLRQLSDLQVQRRIEESFTSALVERGLRPSLLLWDASNGSPYIEKGETLPHTGKAKNKRYDLNLVGMALAVAEDHIPLLHEVGPGNLDESEVFEKTVEALALRLTRLHLDTSEMIMVMDKGPNSEENLAKVTEWMHVVGALPANMAPDLMDLDLDRFSPLHATGRGHELLGYLTRRTLYDQEFHVAVTYNAATAKRKGLTFARYETKFLEGMAKLKAGYERTSGRQVGYSQAAAKAALLVPSEYASALKYELSPNPKTLAFHVDEEQKARLLRHFGRRMFFTDLNWDAEAIVRTYEERTKIEEDFKGMKGDEMLPLSPFFVRTDASILAHSFMAVMGMLLWRLTWKKIRELGFTQDERDLLEAMNELDLVLMSRQSQGELHGGTWKIADHGALAEELLQKLELEKEVPA
jgi:transposase